MLEALEPRTLLSVGPRILSITPTQVINATFDHVDVTFNKAIDPTTFTTGDVSLTGPAGSATIAIHDAVELDSADYQIDFDPLTTRGSYQVAIGPNIADPQGNLMDQNQDGTGGEPNDIYPATLTNVVADTVFATATTINESNTTYDGQNIAIVGTTVAIDGSHSFNSVHLINGAVLTHTADSASQTHELELTVTQQVIVDATSSIDVSGNGYLGGRTTGNTTAGGAVGESGGSYGGLGYSTSVPTATNAVYGDYADPDDWGSGGAGDQGNSGGPGGGLVRIAAATLDLNGQVLADGTNVDNRSAGSGGSIYIAVNQLTGSGLIRAAGGISGNLSSGGGGRVAVYAQDFTGFDLVSSVSHEKT